MESGRDVFDGSLFALISRSRLDISQAVVSVYKARGVKPLEVGERQKIDFVNAPHSSCCDSDVDGCVWDPFGTACYGAAQPPLGWMLGHVTVTPLHHVFHSSVSRRCLSK